MSAAARFAWPAEIKGLGPREVTTTGKCACCGDVVAASYGGVWLCLRRAKEEAAKGRDER